METEAKIGHLQFPNVFSGNPGSSYFDFWICGKWWHWKRLSGENLALCNPIHFHIFAHFTWACSKFNHSLYFTGHSFLQSINKSGNREIFSFYYFLFLKQSYFTHQSLSPLPHILPNPPLIHSSERVRPATGNQQSLVM